MLLRIQILSPPVVVEGGLCKTDMQISACRGGSSLQQRRNFNAVRACEIHEINSPTIFDRSRALAFLGRVFLHGHTENSLRDGFIAEAALFNGMTLVTADRNLAAETGIFGAERVAKT
jgi:hypothetical protein